MSETEHRAADVIDAYRRRRDRMAPLLLGGFAVVLLVVGIFLVVMWLTGQNPPRLALFATRTPTPTQTYTPLPPTLTPTITLTSAPTDTPTPSGPKVYTVEIGDNLYSIAKTFGVTVDALLIVNKDKIKDPSNLPVGTILTIPEPGAALQTETPTPATLIPGTRIKYTVLPGDTLESVASKFNSTAEAIAAANKMKVTDV
jgi:LysM repeat protein